MNNLKESARLNNGVEIPKIGFVTFKIEDSTNVRSAVLREL